MLGNSDFKIEHFDYGEVPQRQQQFLSPLRECQILDPLFSSEEACQVLLSTSVK